MQVDNNSHLVVGENSGSGSGGSQKVVVISSDSAAQERGGNLHVTANTMQPIFKIEKVPSNSLGSHTNSDESQRENSNEKDASAIL